MIIPIHSKPPARGTHLCQIIPIYFHTSVLFQSSFTTKHSVIKLMISSPRMKRKSSSLPPRIFIIRNMSLNQQIKGVLSSYGLQQTMKRKHFHNLITKNTMNTYKPTPPQSYQIKPQKYTHTPSSGEAIKMKISYLTLTRPQHTHNHNYSQVPHPQTHHSYSLNNLNHHSNLILHYTYTEPFCK